MLSIKLEMISYVVSRPFYQLLNVWRWNLDIEVTPAAVTYLETAE